MKMENTLQDTYIQHNTQPASKTTVKNKGLRENNLEKNSTHTT